MFDVGVKFEPIEVKFQLGPIIGDDVKFENEGDGMAFVDA